MNKMTPIVTLAPMVVVGIAVSSAPISLAVTAVATTALAFLGSVLAPSATDKVLKMFFKSNGHPEVAVLPFAFLATLIPSAGIPLATVILGAQLARSLDWNRGLRAVVAGAPQPENSGFVRRIFNVAGRSSAAVVNQVQGLPARDAQQECLDGIALLQKKFAELVRYLRP